MTRSSTAWRTCLERWANTSTYALTNVTLPYAVALANVGWRSALTGNASLPLGLNTHDGQITYAAVVEAFPDLPATPIEAALAA